MTDPSGSPSLPVSAPAASILRTPVPGVACLRCGRRQPQVLPGTYSCAFCGAVLPLQRWVAHPPLVPSASGAQAADAGAVTGWSPGPSRNPARSGTARSKYVGPPAYRGTPGWGFPPVVWRAGSAVQRPGPATPAAPALRRASWVAAALAGAAGLAAGAEAWRFSLLLQGRTEVLAGEAVRLSDALVVAAALATLVLGVMTAILAVPALVRAHAEAATRIDLAPSRRPAEVVARLVVPGWNVYGAGQVISEIDGMLAIATAPRGPADPDLNAGLRRPRASRLAVGWWIAWVLNAVLIVLSLTRGFGGSLQAIADTVELHIAVNLCAMATAGLGAFLLHRFAARLTERPGPHLGWTVAPPEPSRALPVT